MALSATLGIAGAEAGTASERAVSAIVGGAVGDAFGYEVEFNDLGTIRRRFGPQGLTAPVRHGAGFVVSDDTQMTLFTLEGLANAGPDRSETGHLIAGIRDAYLDWYATQQPSPGARTYQGRLGTLPAMWHARAPGTTCLSALAAGASGTPETPINASKGCGGVMRVAPIGVMPGLGDDAARFDLAERAAALTHGHPGGYRPAGAMAVLLHGLVRGHDLDAALDTAATFVSAPANGDETARLLAAARELARHPAAERERDIAQLGQGWLGDEALAIGVYAALAATTFRDAMAIAANHGGDSDSTASIAGQIWGARHGLIEIPEDWVTDLDTFDAMCPLLASLVWDEDDRQADAVR